MKLHKITKVGNIITVTVDGDDREALTTQTCTDLSLQEAQKLGYAIAGCKGDPFVLPVDAATGEVANDTAILDPAFRRKCWRAEVQFAEKFV